MINENFKRDWRQQGGEISIINMEHFSLDYDKDFIGISVSFSPIFRMVHVQILNLVIRFY